jgi:hypothetical protein
MATATKTITAAMSVEKHDSKAIPFKLAIAFTLSLPSTLPSHPRPSLLASIHPTLTHPNLQAVPRAPAMSASSIIGSFFEQYRKTSQLARIVDQFIVFAFLTSVVQMVYVIMVGTFPFNSFLAGFISSLGTMVLLGVLVVFDTAVA